MTGVQTCALPICDGDQLRLKVPRSLATMIGEAVERRFEDLVEANGGKGKIKIGR